MTDTKVWLLQGTCEEQMRDGSRLVKTGNGVREGTAGNQEQRKPISSWPGLTVNQKSCQQDQGPISWLCLHKQEIGTSKGGGNFSLTLSMFHSLAGNFCLCLCILQVTRHFSLAKFQCLPSKQRMVLTSTEFSCEHSHEFGSKMVAKGVPELGVI